MVRKGEMADFGSVFNWENVTGVLAATMMLGMVFAYPVRGARF